MTDTDQETSLAVRLGGFVLAHAAWSVCDGESLCTLAIVENGTGRQLYRFEADSIPQSIDDAHRKLAGPEFANGRWALAYDAYVTLYDQRQDALIVQIRTAGGFQARIIQPYRPATLGRTFKISGIPILIDRTGSVFDSHELEQQVLTGIAQHPKVAKLWPLWSQSN